MFAPGISIEFLFGYPNGEEEKGFDSRVIWTLNIITETHTEIITFPGGLPEEVVADQIIMLNDKMIKDHNKPIMLTILSPTEMRGRLRVALCKAFSEFQHRQVDRLALLLADKY